MEKRPPHELKPITGPGHGYVVPFRWMKQINLACTKWLQERGLYIDDPNWRETIHMQIKARRKLREQEKFDAFIDKLSDQG